MAWEWGFFFDIASRGVRFDDEDERGRNGPANGYPGSDELVRQLPIKPTFWYKNSRKHFALVDFFNLESF